MSVKIKINKTYTVTTYESAEQGEYAEQGMLEEGYEMEWRDLVEALRFGQPSQWPLDDAIANPVRAARVWVTYLSEEDMESGSREEHSVHLGDNGTIECQAWAQRVWQRALRAAFKGGGV